MVKVCVLHVFDDLSLKRTALKVDLRRAQHREQQVNKPSPYHRLAAKDHEGHVPDPVRPERMVIAALTNIFGREADLLACLSREEIGCSRRDCRLEQEAVDRQQGQLIADLARITRSVLGHGGVDADDANVTRG